MIDVIWDMETGDPDDFLTLLLLLGHPEVNLKAVTITPGGADQVHVVRWALKEFGRADLPLGVYAHPAFHYANDMKATGQAKHRVSRWHYDAFDIPPLGEMPPPGNPPSAVIILQQYVTDSTTLLTGAPPKNINAVLNSITPLILGRWVAQGGFAGEGVVPPEKQLEKFQGKRTCPTYNFNGAPKQALAALESPNILERRLVSKNVCHGVYYDRDLHRKVRDRVLSLPESEPLHKALGLIWMGMDYYLRKRPEGKKFHDPLAACCAINPDIGEWAEVELYREKGEWGARLCSGTGTWIIVDYDRALFEKTLLAA